MIQTLKEVSFAKEPPKKDILKEETKKSTEFFSVSLSEEAVRSTMMSDDSDDEDDDPTLTKWCTFEDFIAYCKPEISIDQKRADWREFVIKKA